MAFEGQQSGDIRATLALSQAEALTGTNRTLNLPGGRQIVFPVPAGIRNGQEIRLAGEGQPSMYGGSRGALILTIAIAPAEKYGTSADAQFGTAYPIESVPPPPPPPVNYPPVSQPGAYSSYPPQDQRSLSTNLSSPPYTQPQQPPQQYGTSVPQNLRRRRRLSAAMVLLLIVTALLIIGGSGLVLYTAVISPNQMHAQATATAGVRATGTTRANATTTAQAVAEANATTTAQAQATAQVQATAAALQAIYTSATHGTPVLYDPLSQQDTNNWEVDDKTGGGGCAFTGGSYHATMPQVGFFASCYAQNSNFRNFAFQIQMTILKGDRGGIVFRSDSTGTKFYLLRIDQDGSYDLFLYTNFSGGNAKSLLDGSSPAIHTGLNQTNKVAVVARGSNLYIYVNQQYVASVSDNTYNSGSIAVFAENDAHSTEVAFSKAQVWSL